MSIDHKLDLKTLNGICPGGYFYATRGTWTPCDGGKTMDGWGYIMCERLTKTEKDVLSEYPNVKVSIVMNMNAPEIVHDMVFIGE